MEYNYTIRIPKERIAVLIGKKGEEKRRLEKKTKTRINVDSQESEVTITGEDNLAIFQLKSVIKAVARGFNPEIANLLFDDKYILELIDITDYVKDEHNHLQRVRGRVIGTDGRARNTIERISSTYISVYGKTVGIIGTIERASLTRKAIDSLLAGSQHGSVFKHLEEGCKKLD